MPWKPISELPEEAKDGREVLVLSGMDPSIASFERGCWFAWADGVYAHVLTGGAIVVHPTYFYDFGNGRTMPDAPEDG